MNFEDFFKQSYPNLYEIEKVVQQYWKSIKLDKLVDDYRKNCKKRPLLDGPPYPTADTIHVGTGRTKIVKDVFIRYNLLRGYNVSKIPGYDSHGLPIEIQVEKKLGVTNKQDIEEKIGLDKFIEECKKLSYNNSVGMSKQFERLGVLMDWENPYFTMHRDYISGVWKFFKAAWEKGLVTEEYRPVWWCYRCQTVLADYETTDKYISKEDYSIYVKFPLKERENEYLIIWTTTPWTLPANLAIAIHPELEYVKIKVGDEIWIVAMNLLEQLKEKLNLENIVVIDIIKGKELEGLKYKYILEDLIPKQKELEEKYPAVHSVILADFVSAEEGTGLVHCAPGHGLEDWEVCRKYSIPVFSPVDERGCYTEDVPLFKGKLVFDCNEEIINILKDRGYLIAEEKIVHNYPVCWRCKTPLIFRASKQLFILRTKYKQELEKIVDDVKIYPENKKEMFKNMIRNLPDWAIARQRYWGTPIPLWVCNNCGEKLVFGSVEELEEYTGQKIEDPHKPYIDQVEVKCPKCQNRMQRIPDVFDVWVDSGVGAVALEPRVGQYPVYLVTEGPDQFRGWFMSLLNCGYVVKEKAPYERILTLGWIMRVGGQKMSKSAGVGLITEENFQKIGGADVMRYYILYKVKPWLDMEYYEEEIKQFKQFFIVLWNIFKFTNEYMTLDNYIHENLYKKQYNILDKWIIIKLNKLVKEYIEKMEEFEYSDALRMISDFVMEDISRWYLRLSRERAWKEYDDPEKWAFYDTLFRVLKTVLLLLTPFVPHITEFLYQVFIRKYSILSYPSIQLELLNEPIDVLIEEKYLKLIDELKEVVELGLIIRDEKKIKLRKPLKKLYVFMDSIYYDNAQLIRDFNDKELQEIKEILKKSLNVKEVELLDLNSKVNIDKSDNLVEKTLEKELFYFKEIILDTELDEELLIEGYTREVIRRIQAMRKDMNLEMMEKINVYIYTEDELIKRAIEKFNEYIKNETRAEIILISDNLDENFKRWKIDDKEVYIKIEKIK